MAINNKNTQDDVKQGVSALQAYAALAKKREDEKEAKLLSRQSGEDSVETETTEPDKVVHKSKKEKCQDSYTEWQNTIKGITSNDLIFNDDQKKKKRKRYKEWIVEDIDSGITVEKSKKKKNENYNKKFEPMLNMLQGLVTEQNKFNQDLAKRYSIMAGPANKNAQPLNKTIVELASVMNAGRNNSLGIIKEMTATHVKAADLSMKQRKENRELSGAGTDIVSQDLGIMGSEIVKGIFGEPVNTPMDTPVVIGNYNGSQEEISPTKVEVVSATVIPKFDPTSWSPSGIDVTAAHFESIPHKFIVEYKRSTDSSRFVAVRLDDGQELEGCPLPSTKIKNIKEDTMTASDDFDQIYDLVIIE